MAGGLKIPANGEIDFWHWGRWFNRLDRGCPFRKATQCTIQLGGGESMWRQPCRLLRLKTAIVSAMSDYPSRPDCRARPRHGVKPFYKHFKAQWRHRPNMALSTATAGYGLRLRGFYNRCTEAGALLKPATLTGRRFLPVASAGSLRRLFAALSPTTAALAAR